MKRAAWMTLSAALVVAAGCSNNTTSYALRMSKTLEALRYKDRLDLFLGAPAEDKLKELGIFVRPPKPLELSKAFSLTSNPEQFEYEGSFAGAAAKDGSPQVRLHVLARRKTAKKAPPKGQAAPAEVVKQPFRDLILGLLLTDLGGAEALTTAKLKGTNHRKNNYTQVVYTSAANGDQIRALLYQRDPYDVALIFDIPAAKLKTAVTGIDLCLEAFAVGQKAQRAFEGGSTDEDPAKAGGASAF